MGLTVEDQLAIQALAARYNFAIDTGDGEAFAATFVEGGVLNGAGSETEGRAALAAFAVGFAGSVRGPRHVVTNMVIDGDGKFATFKAYTLVGSSPAGPLGKFGASKSKLERMTAPSGERRAR